MNKPITRGTQPSFPSPLDDDAAAADANRRIVWILPRANEVQIEYVKRCESCPRLHHGQYGSGRFCSSRCARRVGGLAKKRMWDLTHGISSHDCAQTISDERTLAEVDSVSVGERSNISSNGSHLRDVDLPPPLPLPLTSYYPHGNRRVVIPKHETNCLRMMTQTSHTSTSVPLIPSVPGFGPVPKRQRIDTSDSKMSLSTILNPSSS